jgi:hypothetical protein
MIAMEQLADTKWERDVWRQDIVSTTVIGCQPMTLSTGIVVVNATKTVTLSPQAPATFTPYCPDGSLPVPVLKRPSLLQVTLASLFEGPYALPYSDWQTSFDYNALPGYIALGAAAAIIWTVAAAVLSSPRQSGLLKIVGLIVTVCITLTSAELMRLVKLQVEQGYVDGYQLLDQLNDSYLACISLVVANTAALIAQVLVCVRLFGRKREKRIILASGLVLVVITQLLWGFDAFLPEDSESMLYGSLAVLPVLAYLFSIMDSVLFSTCVLVYGISSWRLAYRWDVLALAVLSHISMVGPITLFVLDVADAYIDNWSKYANTGALFLAAVSVTIWVDRIEDMRRRIEYNSVLGRQTYEEDGGTGEIEPTLTGKAVGLTPSTWSSPSGQSSIASNKIEEQSNAAPGGVSTLTTSGGSSLTAVIRPSPPQRSATTAGHDGDLSPFSQARSAEATTGWRHWMNMVKNIAIWRPGTSSSVSTTYVIRNDVTTPSVDALKQNGLDEANEPLTVHTYPARRIISRPDESKRDHDNEGEI